MKHLTITDGQMFLDAEFGKPIRSYYKYDIKLDRYIDRQIDRQIDRYIF